MKSIIFLLSLLVACSAMAGKKKLVTVIGSNMTAPFLLPTADQETAPMGISPDYMKALAAYLGEDIEIRVLPKFRIREQFERGEIDLNCYTTKEWAGEESEKFLWSVPFFTVVDMLVSNQGPVRSLDQVRSSSVGTILRYNYPGIFDFYVKKGDIVREEVKTEGILLNLLAKNRVKYGVIARPQLEYFLKQNPGVKISTAGYPLSENHIRCWVRRGSSLSVTRLNAAIESLKSSGRLDEIFNYYR